MRAPFCLSAALLAGSVMTAHGQTAPAFTFGQVPTPAQWRTFFSGKQDTLGFAPANKAGDVFIGRMGFAPATSTAASLNVAPGTAPNAPKNGDLWSTQASIFVALNGQTFDLLHPPLANLLGTLNPAQLPAPIVVTPTPAANGATTTFVLPVSIDPTHSLVTVGGVIQSAGAYTLTANTVTFGTAPPASASIQITEGALPASLQNLPPPTAYTLGGVSAATGAPHQFATGIASTGAPIFAQPSISDLAGMAGSASVEGTGIPGIDGGPFFHWNAPAAATSPGAMLATLRVDRHTDQSNQFYSHSGSNLFGLWSLCGYGLNDGDYETCTQIQAVTSSGQGNTANHVALYSQITANLPSIGTPVPVWAGVLQVIDNTGADPVTARVPLEIDSDNFGTDAHGSRIALNVTTRRSNHSDPTVPHAAFGLSFTPEIGDAVAGVWDTMIGGQGPIGHGLDLSNFSVSGAAVALSAGERLAFDKVPGQAATGLYSRYLFANSGNLFYHTPDGVNHFALQDNGNMIAGSFQESLFTPASSAAPCNAGQFTDDANYHYVCVATNTWKRVALSAF